MNITKRINNYLNDSIGDEIEDMDMNVELKDRKKFDMILDKALKKIDPKSDLPIKDAVMKLKKRDANFLLQDLLDLHYKK